MILNISREASRKHERAESLAYSEESLTSFARNETTDLAREVALHRPTGGDLFGKYDYGFGDVDLSSIRFSPTQKCASS